MNGRYGILLFDADRTLFDFDRSEETALSLLMDRLGHPLSGELYGVYKRINKSLWDEFERGERDNSTIAPTRFRRFFAHCGIGADPDKGAEDYLSLLSQQRFLLPGAFELCQRLWGHFDMYIVTNGIGSVQKGRFSESELAPFFKGTFISEELGAAKPSPEFYGRALASIGSPDRSRILAIGDSAEADIRGANNAGIDACYFNPGEKALPQGIWAKYTVTELSRIGDILLGEE